jgi:DoxX-like family
MPALPALLATAIPIAAVFLALGSAKVLALAPMRARAAHLGLSTGSYRVIGTLEIAGAIGVLLGLAAPTLGAFAAVGLLLLLAGAVLAHLRNGDNPRLLTPALVSGLFVAAYLAVLIGARP